MKTTIGILLLISISFLGFSQSNDSTINSCNKKESYRKINRNASKKQIEQLKNGILLVRLKTSENKIKTLRKAGKIEKADKTELKQKVENLYIIYAFKDTFKFCEVQFFYSNKSKNIINKEYRNVFLNDSLNVDSSIIIDTNKTIFIAEIANIEQNTYKHISSQSYVPNDHLSLRKEDNYYGGTNFGFEALIIRDNNFVQLSKPFPFFSKANFNSIEKHPEQLLILPPILWLTIPRTYLKTVNRMNKKLYRYYNRVVKQN